MNLYRNRTLSCAVALVLSSTVFAQGVISPAAASDSRVDYKDYIITTYETAMLLRSMKNPKGNPDYDRLISECRYNLYHSMKYAAASGSWSEAKDLIPVAETCSFTGKVLPATTQEYHDHWLQAERTALNSSAKTDAAEIPAPKKEEPAQKQQAKTDTKPNGGFVCHSFPCRIPQWYVKQLRERHKDGIQNGQRSPQVADTPPAATDPAESEFNSSFKELTDKLAEMESRSPFIKKPYEMCEQTMIFLNQEDLRVRRVDLSSKETRVLDDKFRHHARDTCVCAISELENSINNEEAEKYFAFTFENILEPDRKNQAKAIANGLDYQRFRDTEQTVAQAVRQCS
ncbi:hypothetical protein [Brucella pseudogrignonensis]|uniref:hypothetical protein n=1 Tax=Brucella pseudogrignonensis TaxID=419475 RepID=UPI00124F6BB1|nr:hypothetical protein [Brucella pseudogrignonensis]KAB2686789.1 hypothetical protein F9K82_18460 [Brucella pseudogrignonensis]